MSDRVTYRLDKGVATISMDDGKLNVMSTAMLRDLDAALNRAEKDRAIILLRSACKDVFSAGFDLKVFAANDRLRGGAIAAMREAIERELTLDAYEAGARALSTVVLPGRNNQTKNS